MPFIYTMASKLIKCVDTGLEATREESYYVASMRRYFSSKEAYEKWSKPKTTTDAFYRKVTTFLGEHAGFPSGIPFPGIVLRKLRINYTAVGYEPVYLALIEKEKDINYWLQKKDFDNFTSKMLYMLGMIKDIVPVKVVQLRHQKAQQEKTISEAETNVTDYIIPTKKQKVKDLSELFDNEE